ncbi:MAG: gephyrin-like molybdotransferase Glp [Xanthobacteraceae bacterium]
MALMPVTEALAKVLAGVEPLSAEWVPLTDAHGRVLAADLEALRTQPPADVSAMDGYAVRGADVASAPARLTVIGEVAAGRPFSGEVGPGQAARIFTGGVVPRGADTVVIQELTERTGDVVIVTSATARGRNVRAEGLDFMQGETLLRRGERLTSRSLALAAAMNHPQVPVHRRPKVALLATGDELVTPGTAAGPGQIVSSNGFALASLIRQDGAEATDLGIVGDELDTTVAAIERARTWSADVLVTAGGASVGEHDLVQQALSRVGLQLAFWKVALRPGKPLLHGRIADMRVLGVPGNPVSAFVCAFLFLVPLIRRLSGRVDLEPRPESAILGADLPENDERRDYLRATLDVRDGQVVATPFRLQDSSMMAPLAKADCLLIRDPFAAAAPAGSPCTVLKLGL